MSFSGFRRIQGKFFIAKISCLAFRGAARVYFRLEFVVGENSTYHFGLLILFLQDLPK
jgi:hypothetical protein